MSEEKREFVKEDFVIIAFAKKQMFHERKVNDSVVVNVALPSSANYAGYYMCVNKNSIKKDKFREKMVYVYVHKEADKKITYYNKKTKERHEKLLNATELKEEFDSWRTHEDKEHEEVSAEVVEPEEENICTQEEKTL